MSIAYQSWEMGSGPTVGYKMHHSAPAPGDGFNFSTRDAIPRGITALIYRQQHHLHQHQHQHQHQLHQQQQHQQPPQQEQDSGVKLNMNSNGCAQVQRFAITVPSSTREESSTGTTRSTLSTATAAPSSLTKDVLAATKSNNMSNIPCSSSSSSIVTSSISGGGDSSDESDDKEVQSSYKGPLEQMDTLMTTLPIRRGLSKFYNGRSRSFTSLAEVKSIKDLAKPENPYAKRRKLPIGHKEGLDRHRFPPPRVSTAAGIAKKPTASSSNGTTLTLAVAMSSLESEENTSNSSSSRWQKCNRSLSLTDLQKA